MKIQFVFNTAEELQEQLKKIILMNRCKMLRVFEYEKSYEDYSISFTLRNEDVFNFVITEDQSNLILKKKSKKSTRHIQFPKGTTCTLEYVNKRKPYIAMKIMADVWYTDGTRRYN